MTVYVTHAMIGDTLQLAGVFAVMEDAYGFLSNNGLFGNVEAMEVIGVEKGVEKWLLQKR